MCFIYICIFRKETHYGKMTNCAITCDRSTRSKCKCRRLNSCKKSKNNRTNPSLISSLSLINALQYCCCRGGWFIIRRLHKNVHQLCFALTVWHLCRHCKFSALTLFWAQEWEALISTLKLRHNIEEKQLKGPVSFLLSNLSSTPTNHSVGAKLKS